MRIETDLDGAVVSAIERHYMSAIEKHPYFCDSLTIHGFPYLPRIRMHLADQIARKDVYFYAILDCELAEAQDALNKKNTPQAIEEIYDCIAVLLRAIDVLQGRQALGKPKEDEVAKC